MVELALVKKRQVVSPNLRKRLANRIMKENDVTEEMVDLILKKSNNPQNVIDIGCGDGDLLIKFRKRGLEVTGLDGSEVALDKAKSIFADLKLRADFIKADFNTSDFISSINNKPFDLVVIRLSFAFVDDKDSFCESVKKILSPNGTFVCSTPILLEGEDYDDRQNRISVSENKIENILNSHFNSVSILVNDESNRPNWPLRTYLCKLD
ncbi:MAG: class I SAM-dependent methyltransferase [Candidatus Paceibacterota bacterium]